MAESFTTGNEVIAKLPNGTLLEVVGQGELAIVPFEDGSDLDLIDDFGVDPAPTFAPGDRISTHHGPATVVRKSDRIDFDLSDGEILYVADSDPVVRRIFVSEVSAL